MPCPQTKWSWDCLTPYTALTGRCVSASAYAFAREVSTKRVNFGPTFHRAAENVPVAHPQQSGMRGQASEPGNAD
jgi:hypothetical protein